MKYNCENINNHCSSHFYNDFSYLLKKIVILFMMC